MKAPVLFLFGLIFNLRGTESLQCYSCVEGGAGDSTTSTCNFQEGSETLQTCSAGKDRCAIIRGGLNGVANTVTYECHSSDSCQTSNDVNNLFGDLFNNLGVSANTYCCEADKCNSQNADGGSTTCNFSFALLCTISTLYVLLGNLY